MLCKAEEGFRKGAMLTVPILWTTQDGSEPLGVVNLSDRRSGQAFTAGDQKLVTAIASQIGAAIQNARLVRQSLDQQRLQQEMQLAHDLQMKLLPDAGHVAPEATVSARVVPAEDVGGDFYNLYRLVGGRIGVMIGDVSGHGYQAALIMALTMSASAIHAQGTDDPAEMLRRLYQSVKEELTTTEMFVSALYAVVDRELGVLRYGNTGHPHAFVVTRAGDVERLFAGGPPLGMSDEAPRSEARPWDVGAARVALAKHRGECAVVLDGDEPAGALGEDVGQRSPAWSDLEHRLAPVETKRVGDAAEDATIGEEVLAEALSRRWVRAATAGRRASLVDHSGQLLRMTSVRSSLRGVSPV
jgi:hypothetical protein